MEGLAIRGVVAVVISFLVAIRAFKHRSLSKSGAFVGFLVLSIHIAASYRFGAIILVFFFTSSKFTKLGEDKKRGADGSFKVGGQRNWIQVLSNSGIATIFLIAVGYLTGWKDVCLDSKKSSLVTILMGGIIGHYACCNGDTWSSELGMLSNSQPRLITTFKVAPKGTNGAVTVSGLLAAAAAGSVIGLTFILVGLLTARCTMDVAMKQLLVFPLGMFAGIIGSVTDSLLGATMQFSGFCSVRKKVVGKPGPTVKRIAGVNILDNNGVNLVSVLISTLLTSIACLYIF
ncbi:unnamed protein product [Victoria cruziana]